MAQTSTPEALLAEWIAAFNAYDLDRHMRLYMENATLFGSTDELQVGREAIRAYFAKRPPTVRVVSYPMPRVTPVSPDLALTAGHVEFALGDEPMPYRMTWVLVRQDGQWRIAQHHGSPRLGS
jgi:uncharacterized protein (TIGR02246 family)